MLISHRTSSSSKRTSPFARKPSYKPKPLIYQIGIIVLRMYLLLVIAHGVLFFLIGFPLVQATNSMDPTLQQGDTLFVFRLAYGIPGISPLLKAYWSQPGRGDLVVFPTPYRSPETFFIGVIRFFIQIFLFGNELVFLQGTNLFDSPGYQVRRVVGVPGDTIVYRLGEWFIQHDDQTDPISELLLSTREYRVRLPEIRSGEITPFGDTTHPIILGSDEWFVAADNRTGSLDSRFYGVLSKDKLIGRVVFRYYPFQRVGFF